MGMFDMIIAELECPETSESKQTEIQIKWREVRNLKPYRIGDILDELFPEYNNAWIRTDYVCPSCSPKTKSKHGEFIKVEDQRRHYCYVRVEDSRLVAVISEKDFLTKGIEDYVDYE